MKHRLALGLLMSLACGDRSSPAPREETPPPAAPQDEAVARPHHPHGASMPGAVEHGEDPGAPVLADPELLRRAPGPGSWSARGLATLDFQAQTAVGMYALEAAVAAPDWGRTGKQPLAVRDDDLDTGWTCELDEEAPCALGLQFEDPAAVTAIRIYSATGSTASEVGAHPRIAAVRIHTDAGYAEAELPDGAEFRYVFFDEPIETRTLTVEVRTVHPGATDTVIRIAELDAIGMAGRPRPPLDVDPSAVYVRLASDGWTRGETWRPPTSHLEQLVEGGKARRLLAGTALLGRAGDRFLLVESLASSDCTSHPASYVVLDRVSRLMLPVDGLANRLGPVLRHGEGMGFATRSEPPLRLDAVVRQPRGVTMRHAEDFAATSPAEQLRSWGFEAADPLPRGPGRPLEDPPAGCAPPPPEHARTSAIAQALGGKLETATVLQCEIPGGHALFAERDCGKRWAIETLSAEGDPVGALRSDATGGRGLRLARLAHGGLVVETTAEHGDHPRLYRVEVTGPELVAESAAFALRPPANCATCDDRFVTESAEAKTDEQG